MSRKNARKINQLARQQTTKFSDLSHSNLSRYLFLNRRIVADGFENLTVSEKHAFSQIDALVNVTVKPVLNPDLEFLIKQATTDKELKELEAKLIETLKSRGIEPEPDPDIDKMDLVQLNDYEKVLNARLGLEKSSERRQIEAIAAIPQLLNELSRRTIRN